MSEVAEVLLLRGWGVGGVDGGGNLGFTDSSVTLGMLLDGSSVSLS